MKSLEARGNAVYVYPVDYAHEEVYTRSVKDLIQELQNILTKHQVEDAEINMDYATVTVLKKISEDEFKKRVEEAEQNSLQRKTQMLNRLKQEVAELLELNKN